MKNLLIILLTMMTTLLSAQKHYEVDLSSSDWNQPSISLDYDGIKLINKIPNAQYIVKIEVEEELNKDNSSTKALNDECSEPEQLTKIKKSTDENDVATEFKSLKKASESEKDQKKKACLGGYLKEAEEITTEVVDFKFKLEKNQNINITITRKESDKIVRTWSITLRTPRTVNYISHFGFTFVPNGIRNSDRYFSKETAANTYTITQLNNNGSDFWKDLSLTANYIIPICKLTRSERLRFGWNGGFGLSGDARFTVFTGPTILFDDFLSLNFNAGLYNKYKLKGEYEPGQQITENLSIDQLNEQGLRPAFMISLGFRLSKEQLQATIENKGSK